ncbi:N-acetyltransferase family protein [Aquihabitans sp. McL0605]|uniref:GNAT family N-acetyltransferase n=1 Tax=Aquihabitans sp. McL0605 TaxID=3415671 RepID=UPI003CF05CD5
MDAARVATGDDLAAITELATEAVAELSELRGGAVWRLQDGRQEPVEAGIKADVARPRAEGLAVVATIHEVVVGYGISRIDELADGSPLSVITDLYVHPEARGIGLGEAMMDLLVAHANEVGAVGIDSLALPGDRGTKNFFETFGLKARAIVVHRSLRPTDDPAGSDDGRA